MNIETNEFDKAITTIEESITPPHTDTLMCSRPRCKCVSSELELVENKILKSLKIIMSEYKNYVNNYEEAVKKEICTNKEMIEAIDHEIDKIKSQIEKGLRISRDWSIYSRFIY